MMVKAEAADYPPVKAEYSPVQLISAQELLSRFEQMPLMKEKKCTNIPKFIFNLLLEVITSVEAFVENGRHIRWVSSIKRKYFTKDAQGRNQSRSRFSLMELLQNEVNDSSERRLWKSKHRECLQHKLATERFRNILTNCSIPDFNKMHYLYYCKLYEWRLNNPFLLGHLT